MTDLSAPAAPTWSGKMTNVAKPALLAWMAGLTAVLGAVAVLSLVFLNQALKAQPRTINPAVAGQFGATLAQADWASSGGTGPALYVVGFPTCPSCLAFKKTELKRFLAAKVEVRAIEFAPRRMDGASIEEEAMAAEVSRSRSWASYLAPSGSYSGSSTGDVEYVERGRLTVAAIEADLKASRTNIAFPAFFWRIPGPKGDQWRYVLGSNAKATDNILAELRASGAS
ncbi:MAG: hypothetical protein ABWZ40_11245 [Caulobacterales bacterium]